MSDQHQYSVPSPYSASLEGVVPEQKGQTCPTLEVYTAKLNPCKCLRYDAGRNREVRTNTLGPSHVSTTLSSIFTVSISAIDIFAASIFAT